ncbi:MAG: DUF4349 domain-containing protein [Micrococcales bacterium]|nr:DUF4349 domain-containing protein [Micrococcales bacterium]
MTTARRLSELASRHRRILLAGIAAAILLAVAVPVGMTTLSGRWGDRTTPSVTTKGSPAARPDTSGEAARAPGSPAQSTADRSAAGPAKGTESGAVTALVGSKIARSVWLGVEVKDLTAASDEVRRITSSAGGQVLSEDVVTRPDPTGGSPESRPGIDDRTGLEVPPVGIDQARLSVRVPVGKLDAALAELARLGSVSYRSSQAEDVTGTYVDTKARITTMQAGVDSIQALLAKAKDLGQVISLERELTDRQADLDAHKARLTALDRRTTTSDITVSLWTSAAGVLAPGDDNAFVNSVTTAWTAFLSSVAVIVTGLAVLAPWILIALAVAFLLRRVLRRRLTSVGSAPGGTSATTADPPGVD